MKKEIFVLREPFIRADHLLQRTGIAQSGGEAGFLIRNGLVKINDKTIMEKRKKIVADDKVDFDGQRLITVKASV